MLVAILLIFIGVVQVCDGKDNHPPLFEKQYYCVEFAENNDIGALVLQINATDVDWNDTLHYKVVGSDDFKIDDNGNITAKKSFDREIESSYKFTVEVSDGVSRPFTAQVEVRVQITDLNDNRPVFKNTPYSEILSENTNIGRTVLQVVATDSDLVGTQNSLVQYKIIDGDPDGHFTISRYGGVITLTSQLDYESGNTTYILWVTATNVAAPKASDSTRIVVNVTDSNDNSPVFQKNSFVGNQNENTAPNTFIVKVLATDKDSGSFGQITYSIVSGNDDDLFEINNATGDISNKKVLDRETQASYTLMVQAVDRGANPRTAQAIVNIAVNDINDNRPIFSTHSVVVSLAENNEIGTPVAFLTATDDDIGTNSALTYEILSGNTLGAFQIANSSIGHVTARIRLDYEQRQNYTLRIGVRDGGPDGGLSDNVTLTVNVKNRNDNSPVFSSSFYTFSVIENQMNRVIGSVFATDADGSSPNFDKVTYSLAGEYSDRFSIDSSSGQISTALSIDREDDYGDVYHLLVTATDNAPSPLSAVAKVEVTITDVNDNSPVFNNGSYVFEIQESASVGQLVGFVSASDADDPGVNGNGRVTYSLTGTGARYFTLDETSGRISVASLLDYERKSSYGLKAVARDGGGRTSKVAVSIKVIDENDNRPEFVQASYATSVDENVPLGSPVLQVSASEKDTMKVITYSLTGGGGHFDIDRRTGQLVTAGSIDFETKKQYTLRVTAEDSGNPPLHSSVLVTVNVRDLNDNAPYFPKTDYESSLKEELPSGQNIVTVTATDKDSSLNGAVSYTIVEGIGKDHFSIDSSTGHVTTTMPLDRERQDRFILTVQAQDGGSPPKSTIATLIVTVQDTNDNKPEFSASAYFGNVGRKAQKGTAILTVTATDRDAGPNSAITYSFADPGNVPALFIDPSKGTIATRKTLEGTKAKEYKFNVIATDQGAFPQSSVVPVVIQVKDKTTSSSFTASASMIFTLLFCGFSVVWYID